MIASLVVLALVLLGLIWWIVARSAGGRATRARETPLPLFAVRTPGRGVPVVGHALAGSAAAATPARDLGWNDVGDDTATGAVAAARSGTSGALTAEPRGAPVAAPVASSVVTAPDAASEPESAEGQWAPPAVPMPARTVQFLPGRLEVVQGRGVVGQEVRFVRPERPGERAVVTFGRGAGAPYRHVQLKVATVSRLHARMALEPGTATWTLENLSSTNPVVVNGVELPAGAAPRPLADGDRVEMGEVVFIYRGR